MVAIVSLYLALDLDSPPSTKNDFDVDNSRSKFIVKYFWRTAIICPILSNGVAKWFIQVHDWKLLWPDSWCIERTYQFASHYNDVIMSAMASQITSPTIVYSTAYSGTDQRKYQSSAQLAFVRGIHLSPVNSPHKWPVTRKCFHLMTSSCRTFNLVRSTRISRAIFQDRVLSPTIKPQL